MINSSHRVTRYSASKSPLSHSQYVPSSHPPPPCRGLTQPSITSFFHQLHSTRATQSSQESNPPQASDNPQEPLLSTQSSHLKSNVFIGNPITIPKPPDTLRLYFCNINGIRLSARGGDFTEFLSQVTETDADILGVAEHNLDTSKQHIKFAMQAHVKTIYSHSKLVMSSSSIPSVHDFKPGGTFTIAQGNIVSRIVNSGTDALGRWSYIELAGKQHRNVVIITAYQVCNQSYITNHTIKSLTAAAQQYSILQQHDRLETPREAFIHDVSVFVKTIHARNHGVLLVGDFNEHLKSEHTGMTGLAIDCNLTDLMFNLIGEDAFPTYVRGTYRIDYILASDWIANSVIDGCYEPFSYRTKGDHRNIVIDFNIISLLGTPTYQLSTPILRNLVSNNRASIRKFLVGKTKYLEDHHFSARLQRLEQVWDPELAEKLDRDWIKASLYAENLCTKPPNYAYVQQLASLRTQKNVLCRVISQHRLGVNMAAAIAKQASTGINFQIPSTVQECQTLCRQTQHLIRQLEKDSLHLRKQELENKAIASAQQGDKINSKRLRILLKAEQTKYLFQKLKKIRNVAKQGITKLEVPKDPLDTNYKECKEWITITLPQEIEEKLRQRNQGHFGQAAGSFPTVSPFSEWVDWTANSHVAELILEGAFQSDELTDIQQLLLTHMKSRTTLDLLSDSVTSAQFLHRIKKWPERTTTSPSGFHLGHSKALLAEHDKQLDSPEGIFIEECRQKLQDWQIRLLNVALNNKYSYQRWKVIVNVMILKEPANYKLHRLRVIHLYEHDYNLVLGIKWKEIIRHSLHCNSINTYQFGGLPGKDSLTPTLIEELQYEISKASRRPLVHVDYDAESCYDRIIPSIAMLASRAYGMHRNICVINATTLQEAKYLLKTQLGISETAYSHSSLRPLYGTGQGSANSPMIWCLISSVLFDAYQTRANGAVFQSPQGDWRLSIYMIGFVDDTSGSSNDFTRDNMADPEYYLTLAKQDAQLWNDLLCATGGRLGLEKCSYHFLYFDFTVQGAPFLSPTVYHDAIKIDDAERNVSLQSLTPYKAHKTLGTFKEPAGYHSSATKAFQDKSDFHLKILARNSLTASEAWTFYHAIYIPSVAYPLASGFIQPKKLAAVDRKLKQVLLPKLGYARNSNIPVVFGPVQYAGIHLRQQPVEQGLLQIKLFLKHWRAGNTAGTLLRIAIAWAQLLSGSGSPILEDTSTQFPQLSILRWITSLRAFLQTINAKLILDTRFVTPIQRQGDIHLTDLFMRQTSFKPSHLAPLTACRLYLQVVMLSDIVIPSGFEIEATCFEQTRPLHSSIHSLFPYQINPSKSAWDLWKRYLRKLVFPRTRRLKHPLGKWLVSGQSLHRQWNTLHSDQTGSVYKHQSHHSYAMYIRKQYGKFEYHGIVSGIPNDSYPIDSQQSSQYLQIIKPSGVVLAESSISSSDFQSYLRTLPRWEQDLLHTVDTIDSVESISRSMQHHRTLGASDGSVATSQGTYGWLIAQESGSVLAKGGGIIPTFGCTSYRAEAYGLLSLVLFCRHLQSFTSCDTFADTTIYTDSKSLLSKVDTYLQYDNYYPTTTLDPDWDILQAIVTNIRTSSHKLKLHHVKSHQDKTSPVEHLPIEAQLNVLADNIANEMHNHPSPTKYNMIPGTGAYITINDNVITSNYNYHIRTQASSPQTRDHILQQENWTQTVFDSVAWDSHKMAIQRLYPQKKFICKLVHNLLPTGKRVHRYGTQYAHQCPSCQQPNEDRIHVLICPHRRLWRSVLHSEIVKYIQKNPTHPSLAQLLLFVVSDWLPGSVIAADDYHTDLKSLIRWQFKIGWHQIFLGRFTQHWNFVHDTYLKHKNMKTQPGSQWLPSIIAIIWQHVFETWKLRCEHRHGNDPKTCEIALVRRLQREIQLLYALKPRVLPSDSNKFYSDVDEHFRQQKSSRELQQWITTWKPVLLQSEKVAQLRGVHQSMDIRRYFTPS
jgi:exonuclease III